MFDPKCLAVCTRPTIGDHIGKAQDAEDLFFRSVEWSADGTCLIATLSNGSIQTFIVPVNLLDESQEPHTLAPYCTIQSGESVNAVAGYTFFNLQDPSTALALSSMRDHPIRLNSALTGQLVASYSLINPMTEAFICPHSLLFSPLGDRFIAGSDSLISTFDVSRSGGESLSSISTGPKRGNGIKFNSTINMRGIVSALAVDASTGVLAAGTFDRSVGLYDSSGQGDCVGVFSVKGTTADGEIGGGGITQVSWSPCGRYLYIAERKSAGLVLYDIRKTGQLLAWLEGRRAQTNQRLAFDLAATDGGVSHEIWAGGLDGFVKMWKKPYEHEGSVAPTFDFEGHNDVVSSAVTHRCGNIIATSSGQRSLNSGVEEEKAQKLEPESCVKIWSL